MSDRNTIEQGLQRKKFHLSSKIIGYFVMSIFTTVATVIYTGSASAYERSKKRLGAMVALVTSIYAEGAGGAIRLQKPDDLVFGFESPISDAAVKPIDMISEIDCIAFQANLGAARASDAGNGLTVVAPEGRTLVQRSSQAANDIAGLIGESTIHGVERIVNLAEAIDGNTAASHEQSVGVDEVSDTVSYLDAMTQRNAALPDQSAATAWTLPGQTQSLANTVGAFGIEVPIVMASCKTAKQPDAMRKTARPLVVKPPREILTASSRAYAETAQSRPPPAASSDCAEFRA